MSLRFCCGALGVALLVIQLGCCCATKAPWPCGKTWYENQCGCFYWHEWFSHRPCCCDPCNQCGYFTASMNPYVKAGPPTGRFGPLYDDGSRANRQAGAIGEPSGAPTGPTPAVPTPATPPEAQSPGPGVIDEPTEELPGPMTSQPRGYPRMAASPGPVDSPRYSRTLGRPPRTRLFSR